MSKTKQEYTEQNAYMFNSIKQEIVVSVMGKNQGLPCSELADGCVGVSLWFDTLENAVAYGGNKDCISTATYIQRQIVDTQQPFNKDKLESGCDHNDGTRTSEGLATQLASGQCDMCGKIL